MTCDKALWRWLPTFCNMIFARWRVESIVKLIFLTGFLILICDLYIFPLLFSNIVHSRYFSLRCTSKNESSCQELDNLFSKRHSNCVKKANRYWKEQAPKSITTSPSAMNTEINPYWSYEMAEFLGHNKQDTLDLLIMVVSVRRRHGSYLKHITKLLHRQIDQINRQGNENKKIESKVVDLIVCNPDAEIELHEEATHLSSFLDVISINRTKRSHKCCTKENW